MVHDLPPPEPKKVKNLKLTYPKGKEGDRAKALDLAKDAIEPLLCGPSSNQNQTEAYMCYPPPVIDGHAIPANGWHNACCY